MTITSESAAQVKETQAGAKEGAAIHDKRCPAALNTSDPCNCGEAPMGTFNCPLCGKNTPHHHSGVWTLTAPDGRQWHGDSPIKACREEQRSRIPDEVAVKRVMQEPEWDDNPDGIKPGEERGHRMNRDTGFWE